MAISTQDLSPREVEIVRLAAEGLTDIAIAHRLGIGEATVNTYWSRIRLKSGRISRTELVASILRSEYERTVKELRGEVRGLVKRLQESSESYYQRVLAEAADAILITSESGMIRHFNRSAEELLGWKEVDLVGKYIADLIPAAYRVQHEEHVRSYVVAPSRKEMGGHLGTAALHKNGSEIPVAANLAAMKERGQMTVICIIRKVRN